MTPGMPRKRIPSTIFGLKTSSRGPDSRFQQRGDTTIELKPLFIMIPTRWRLVRAICTLARFTVTTNDSMKGLDGNIIQPTNKKLEIEVCRVTHWKNREIVEQRVFYDLVGMQKQIGVM